MNPKANQGGHAAEFSRRKFFGYAAGGAAAMSAFGTQAFAQSSGAIGSVTAPTSAEYILSGASVISLDPKVGTLHRADIHVKAGKIVDIAAEIAAPGIERVDCTGKIAIPGLCDSHWHMWNSLFKNMITPSRGYYALKLGLGPHHTAEDYYIANRLSLAEAIDSGITSVLNYSHNIQSPAHADAELRAMSESGIRGRYAYAGADPTPYDQSIDLEDVRRIASQWFPNGGMDASGRLGLALAERAPGQAVDAAVDRRPEEYRLSQELNVPLALHAGTSPTRSRLPTTMNEMGFFTSSTLFIHGLMMQEEDIDLLIEKNGMLSVAISPDYGTGRGDQLRWILKRMLAADATISLSCDASSLTPTSMFEQMRAAWYLSNAQVESRMAEMPAAAPEQILRMGTINGLKSLSLGDVAGTLSIGKAADIVLIDARQLNMAPIGDELEKAVLHSAMTQNVEAVIIDGTVKKWAGSLVDLDVEQIRVDAERALYDIRTRAGGELAPIAPPQL